MNEGRAILKETLGFGLAFLMWCAATFWFVPDLAAYASPMAAMAAYSLLRIN